MNIPRHILWITCLLVTLQPHAQSDTLGKWIYSRLQQKTANPQSKARLLDETIKKCPRQPRTPEEMQAWLDLLINEGYTWLLAGDIVRSTDGYASAFQFARTHTDFVDPYLVMENILKPLGNNYTRLGDYDQALYIHRKALSIAQYLDDKQSLAGTYSNLANTASNMNQPRQALEYCELGLRIPNISAPLRGLLLSGQADAFFQLGQQQLAESSIKTAIAILQSAPDAPTATGATAANAYTSSIDPAGRDNAASAYWLLTAYQQAGDIVGSNARQSLSWYQRALALQQKLEARQENTRLREKAKLYQRLASRYLSLGDDTRAQKFIDACLSIWLPNKSPDKDPLTKDPLTKDPLAKNTSPNTIDPKNLVAENTLADCLFTNALLAQRTDHPDEALRLFSLCFATEKLLRAELISGSSRELSVTNSRQRFETAIHTAWQYRNIQYMVEFMEDSKAQLLLDEQRRQSLVAANAAAGDSISQRILLLERALVYNKKQGLPQKDIEWQLARLRPRQNIPSGNATTLPEIKDYLVRTWFAASDALYTVEFDDKKISWADRQDMPAGWTDSIEDFTTRWFGSGPRNMLNHPEKYYRQAFAIYKNLFSAHPLVKDKKYILMPDGPLNGLPIEALPANATYTPDPGAWPYLLWQNGISYAWSLATLDASLHGNANTKGIAGFFVADGKRDSLPQLMATAREATELKKLVPETGGSWFLNEEATTYTLRQSLSTAAIVHVSSHAFSGKDSSTVPRIELHDAPFFIFECNTMPHHPSLVVLNACRTGDGRMVTGEGAQSLARAFTAGGASAVVSGWWNLNDETASALMQNFYRILLPSTPPDNPHQEFIDAAQSLRLAKLAWLASVKTPFPQKLPWYWSALNYTGNPTPLPGSFQQITGNKKFPTWLFLLIPVSLLTVWLIRKKNDHSANRSC